VLNSSEFAVEIHAARSAQNQGEKAAHQVTPQVAQLLERVL
jgi:hypothetical protein